MGGSKAGGLPTLPFPLSLPSPFPFPLSFQTNQWAGREGQIQCGGSSPASPYKYHAGYLRCVPPFRYNSTASRTDRRTDVEVNRDRADRVVTREKSGILKPGTGTWSSNWVIFVNTLKLGGWITSDGKLGLYEVV